MGNEAFIRLSCFLVIFILMAGWENIAPRRILTHSKTKRWLSNLSLVFLNTFLVRVLLTLTPVGMAAYATERGWGILNTLEGPTWFIIPVALIALDFVIYLQHVMFHAIPLLWRIHMVHHTDLDFDVTTGNRFHPIEILLSMGIKTAAVILIGVPPFSVLIFEVILNGTSMFNHSNVRIPTNLDRFLRLWIVTPDMHRVHHSICVGETNSNFGFNLPWWDKLMGTYKASPKKGHTEMTIGLSHFRDPKRITFPWLLGIPFTGGIGNYPLNQRDE